MKLPLKRLTAPMALLAAALVLAALVTPLSAATWPQRIQNFELSDPVYTGTVPPGTGAGDLALPSTLRAVVTLPDGADPGSFVQANPSSDGQDAGGQLHYTAPEDASSLYASGATVVYTFAGPDTGGGDSGSDGPDTVAYRVYGALGGGQNQWYACDKNGGVTALVADVPVTWSSEDYDPNTLGDYTFTASISGYMYGGARPIAKVTVSDQAVTVPDSGVLSGCHCGPGGTPLPPGTPSWEHREDCPYYSPPECTCQPGPFHIHDPENPDCPLYGKDTVEIYKLSTGEKAAMAQDDADRIADAQARGQILYPVLGKIDVILNSFQSGRGYDIDMVIL